MVKDGTVLSNHLIAYCKNNPTNYLDFGGTWFLAFCAVVVGVVATSLLCNVGLSVKHRDYNKKHDKTGLVYNQKEVTMNLGATTVAKMGCGAVATHNAIILAGESSSLAAVVEYMEARDLTLGFAGVYFTNIKLYLEKKGFSAAIHYNQLKKNNNIDEKIKNSKRKIAILSYMQKSGGHYVAVKYNPRRKRFNVYNCTKGRIFDSIDKFINSYSLKFLCLITI